MKLSLLFLVGCIVLVKSVITQIQIDNQSLDKSNDLEYEWEIISEFMKNNYVVTLFVEKSFEDVGDKILKYSLINYRFGVFHYNNLTLISEFWLQFQKCATYASRIYGGILIMNDLYMMDFVIKASYNNRLVLVLFNMNVDYIKKLMWNIWNTKKTYEMIILSVNSTGNNTIIQLNPFEKKYFEYPLILRNSSESIRIVELINYRYGLFMSNMAGYGIKISIYELPLIMVLVRNSSKHVIDYSGVDGTLLKLCKKFMNFTTIFITEMMSENKNDLGSLQVVNDGYAEIGINSRFIPGVLLSNTVFLYPMNRVSMVFVVPIYYEVIPLKILTYACFDITSRIIIAILLFVVTAIWMIGGRIVKKNLETATRAIPFKIIALLHNVSVAIPRTIFNQIMFITVAYFSLLLTSIYQGTIVEQLNSPLKPHQIKTLNDLRTSNLNITTLMFIKETMMETNQNNDDKTIMMGPIGQKTLTAFATIPEGLNLVAYNKTTAFLMPNLLYFPYTVQYFNKTTGLDLLHLINEPITSMLLSYAIARNSPFIRIVNWIVQIFSESGILQHEMSSSTDQRHLYYIRRIKAGFVPKNENDFRPIELRDIFYLKMFMFITWSLSVFIFLMELVVYFLLKCKSKISLKNCKEMKRLNKHQ